MRITIRTSLLFATLLLAAIFPLHASTPGLDTLVNYDTAWTFVYDGGKENDSIPINDDFYDIKCLNDNSILCVGSSSDTTGHDGILLMKIDSFGKMIWKKLFSGKAMSGYHGGAIAVAQNGDFLIGGSRSLIPWILRTDSLGNLKWQTWLYDTVTKQRKPLTGSAVINSLQESSRGTIICAAGEQFPGTLDNYADYLDFDSLGNLINYAEWRAVTGYEIGGSSIAETKEKGILLAGNQTVLHSDSMGNSMRPESYSVQVDGVGSLNNNVCRVKELRDNTSMVIGQAYEENCWAKYKKYYYDAWWSPIGQQALNLAGVDGGDDYLYDFTQLKNGNLIFIGEYPPRGGIWTFVTDSIGKQIFWRDNFAVPYKNLDGKACRAYAASASNDGGFSVAGAYWCNDSNGAYNAFAAHFIPQSVSAVFFQPQNMTIRGKGFIVRHYASKIDIQLIVKDPIGYEVSLFNISGKRLFRKTGSKDVAIDMTGKAKGTYFVEVRGAIGVESEKILWNQ